MNDDDEVAAARDEVDQYRAALEFVSRELDDLAKLIVECATATSHWRGRVFGAVHNLEDLVQRYRSAAVILDAHAKALVRATDAWGWAITRAREKRDAHREARR
jgi:hypothetical protein